MISYQKKFIRIAEYWHSEPATNPSVDLMRFFQQPEPLADSVCREFYTISIDLLQDQSALLANMKRNTRYEIRRGEISDGFIYQIRNGNEPPVLDEFADQFDRFAAVKGQPKLNRAWLSMVAMGDELRISEVGDSKGEALVWHAYHVARGRATLLHSASILRPNSDAELRNQVGRANRYHHWRDILHFKERGLATYDFGGWYEKKEDRHRLNINKFKECFGGKIVKTYICERPLTLKGRVFLKTRQLLLGNAI